MLKCTYCGREAIAVTGKDIYPTRYDLHRKNFWKCPKCDAYVGCHNGTTKPLGELADAKLRAARMQAHAVFDPLWRNPSSIVPRHQAYRWLADRLGVPPNKCHIGVFDIAQCAAVVQAVASLRDDQKEA